MPGHTFRRVGAMAILGEGKHEWGCFADEVVIDFPSVAPAVDRMRSAFVADEYAAALATAIQLTPGEARSGAVLPLRVPVRCTCDGCGGRGETWPERCSRCHGSGNEVRQHALQVAVPAGVRDGTCFRFSVKPRSHPPTRVELRVLIT